MTSERAPLIVALAALGVLVFVYAVPGVFTTDDDNYLINVLLLRQGRVTVANTEGLTPSSELLFFEPGPWTRAVESTPVASTAPPLYALVAWPFSFGGWRGLVALNTLAYVATTLMVFAYARRYGTGQSTPWLAAAAFALGGFAIEYAQGVWPQALSMALCTAGIAAAGRGIEGAALRWAAAAGALLAFATGIRYQNAIILAAAAGGVWLLTDRRWRASVAFGCSAAIPLAASAVINHARVGSWNPISKGRDYLNVPAFESAGAARWSDPIVMFWAKLVDFSVRPQLTGRSVEGWLTYDPVTGAHLMLGDVLQKAFFQSAPWAILGFLLFLLAWLPWIRIPDAQRRQLRLLSLVAGAVLIVFAFSGVTRHEGFVFNQRYLLELLPLAAVAFAWSLDGVLLKPQPLTIGAIAGTTAVLLILLGTPRVGGPDVPMWTFRQVALFKLPLLLATSLAIVWKLARTRSRLTPLLAGLAGACLAWGLTLHLADDVAASHRTRDYNRRQTAALSQALPDYSALIAYWYHKDGAVPLLFNKDIVIIDAGADEGRDAAKLAGELLGRNRRVFLLKTGFPDDVLRRSVDGLHTKAVEQTELPLVEITSQ